MLMALQIARFICIGVAAAAVHLASLYILVSLTHLQPLIANIIAFSIAFQVSYFGHQYWTFAEAGATPHLAWGKFLLIAALGFIMNETLFYTLLTTWHLYYLLAMVIVLSVIPPLTFISSKFWAFRPRALL